MNIELSILKDGGVLMVSDRPMPDMVKRVEFYRDQSLMMLVYQDKELESDLMHYEIPQNIVPSVEKSPDVIVYILFDDHEPIGYKVPLIKVGNVY